MSSKTYDNSDFSDGIYVDRLFNEIFGAGLSVNLTSIDKQFTIITFYFDGTLLAGDITTLDAVVAAHPNPGYMDPGAGTQAPNTAFDINAYYGAGSIVINGQDNSSYICCDSFPGEPTWRRITTEGDIGFSAMAPVISTSSSTDFRISGFTGDSPFYLNTYFTGASGTYTVQETGKYQVSINVPYDISSTITASLSAGVNPQLCLRTISPSTTDLLTSNFPVFDVAIALVLTLRAVLRRGNVGLTGILSLSQGDVLSLFYIPNGLTLTVNLGFGTTGLVWSMVKIA